MNPRRTHEVVAALRRKGFRLREGDHHWYEFYVGGGLTKIRTKVSHGESECSRYHLGKMAGQLHLTDRQFEAFINCPMSRSEYALLMETGGHL